MMYRHCVTFYNENGELIYRLTDDVNLSQWGYSEYAEPVKGGPVEAVFTEDGKTLFVSNYSMEGEGFNNPGCDGCIGEAYDPGFIYKIDIDSFRITAVYKVGAVPKFMAYNQLKGLLLVSNWTSSDVSIINTRNDSLIKSVKVGAHPRGIAIKKDGSEAFVTIMGSSKIARINLDNYEVSYIEKIGKSPRHLCLDNKDSLLYISVNSSNTIVKYNLINNTKAVCKTNSGPRSMILSPDGRFIYVVNYFANTFSKIQTDSMIVVEIQETNEHPIGITGNWETGEIWVACYKGVIEIHRDFEWNPPEESLLSSFTNFDGLFGFEQAKEGTLKIEDTSKEINEVEQQENKEIIEEKEEVKEIVPRVNQSNLSKLLHHNIPEQEIVTLNCHYFVVLGTFSVYENAVGRKNELENKGLQIKLISGKSGMTYVAVNCYESREEAQAAIPQLEKESGIKGWVLKF